VTEPESGGLLARIRRTAAAGVRQQKTAATELQQEQQEQQTDTAVQPKKQLAAIQNCLPKRLRLLGEGGRELQLSPLERRTITQDHLLGFEPALVAAQDQQFVKLLYKWSGRVENFLQTVAGLLMVGAIGFVIVGLVYFPFDDTSPRVLAGYWAGIPAVALGVFGVAFLRVSDRMSTIMALIPFQASLLATLAVGIGAPVLALYVTHDLHSLWFGGAAGISEDERLGRGLQVIFVVAATLLPVLLYFVFDRDRIETVRTGIFRAIFDLDPDIKTLSDAEARYGDRVAEQYGKQDSTLSGRITRGHRFPIVGATILLAFGWLIALVSTSGDAATKELSTLSFLDPAQRPVAFAFLGAYSFALGSVARRYANGDLAPKAYGQIAARIVLALILAWVIEAIVPVSDGSWSLLGLCFLVGVFPESGLLFIRELIPHKIFPPLQEKMPLTELEGIDFYDRARLADEGVTNIQGLVRYDLVTLMLQTRISVSRLVDWTDQAILYIHLGAETTHVDRPAGHGAPEDGSDKADLVHLREFGIRTATDLVFLTRAEGPRPDQLDLVAADDAAFRARLQVVRNAVQGEPLYRCVEQWRLCAGSEPGEAVVPASVPES
jgi:hypothetical protein